MVVSKVRSSGFFFQVVFSLLAVVFNLFLFYKTIYDESFLWLSIGALIFITLPSVYPFISSYNKIEASESEITFVNTILNRSMTFSYSEVTDFKSYLLSRSIGPDGGTNAGGSYGVFEVEFGDKFSTKVSELSFENFDEIKLLIHSKVKHNK